MDLRLSDGKDVRYVAIHRNWPRGQFGTELARLVPVWCSVRRPMERHEGATGKHAVRSRPRSNVLRVITPSVSDILAKGQRRLDAWTR